ncbi:MAG: tRNA (adenosine(37)-N6)-dimethylallyltransferase MiaA [Candidatus Methylumidiphilus sp.]
MVIGSRWHEGHPTGHPTGHLPPAIALMGPTASGKTRLAIQLAQELNGEIISVDSALVYRGMDIGTAKPSLEERQGVPHHLIDILDPADAFSTGQFRQQALQLMAEITNRGRLPLLVGGTMLYFNALFNGLAELPEADAALRRKIDGEAAKLGWLALHGELARVDPEAGARIHPNDPQRIQRALEVYRLTGVPLSELCARGQSAAPPFNIARLIVAPSNRLVLHEVIRQRFLSMLDQGLVEEVKALFLRGDLHPHLPSIRAVGYRQVWAYLSGELNDAQMVERGIIATRQFAKRQFTWLRREESASRFVSEDPQLLQNVLNRVCMKPFPIGRGA